MDVVIPLSGSSCYCSAAVGTATASLSATADAEAMIVDAFGLSCCSFAAAAAETAVSANSSTGRICLRG